MALDPLLEQEPNNGSASKAQSPSDVLDAVKPRVSSPKERPAWYPFMIWGLILVIAVVATLLVRVYAVQTFYINSSSMEPTLKENDRVVVNKLSYRTHDVNRGDIVVIKRNSIDMGNIAGREDDLIKRVIGLSGETLRIENCQIFIDGFLLREPYIKNATASGRLRFCSRRPAEEWEIPARHIFVLGDNRNNSIDSREFGAIPSSALLGRAFVKIWPLWQLTSL